MSDKLSWAILGTGNIARQFAVGLNASARNTLTAVGSRTRASGQAFAQTHKIPTVHASYEAALADPAVQVVYLSLPNSLHHEWTLKALRAGKHVLCEKPLATNAAQAEEMFATARQQGRVLAEAFMYLSHPLTIAVRKAVAAGKIGQVRMVRSSFCYATSKTTADSNVRFSVPLAGGALMDIGCYCTSFAHLHAGQSPSRLSGYAHLHESGVDDYTAGTLAFPNGILSTFTCGMTVQADNTASILGTTGYIEIPIPWKPPAQNAAFTIVAGGRNVQTISAGGDLYGHEADDFAGTVLNGTPPTVTPEFSLANQKTLDTLRRLIGLPF